MSVDSYPTAEVDQCVLCLAGAAVIFSGHVLHGRHRVTAGWCSPCLKRLNAAYDARLLAHVQTWSLQAFLDCPLAGWVGHWVPAMGLRLRHSPLSEFALPATKTTHGEST